MLPNSNLLKMAADLAVYICVTVHPDKSNYTPVKRTRGNSNTHITLSSGNPGSLWHPVHPRHIHHGIKRENRISPSTSCLGIPLCVKQETKNSGWSLTLPQLFNGVVQVFTRWERTTTHQLQLKPPNMDNQFLTIPSLGAVYISCSDINR